MDAQCQLTPAVSKRFRPIAGPFSAAEESLCESLLAALRTRGVRITTVLETRGEIRGVSLYRLRAHCETIDDTRRRLKRQTRN